MSFNIRSVLNEKQWEAAQIINGPVLILAGAGAGKTRVLTYKIAHMVEQGVSPDSIIALTFTNKAAKEMRERVSSILDQRSYIWISTFHSACCRILRDKIDRLGYDTGFTIYDDNDSLTLIKQIMSQLKISEKLIKPQTVLGWINQSKNNNIDPEQFDPTQYGYLGDRGAKIYKLYQSELKRNNSVDFGDLLMLVIKLFEHPDILAYYQDKLRFVLVDEYQDTNQVQYQFLKMLAGKYQNISVVGDEDQAIYGWRGADINNILNFSKNFQNVTTVKLEENYRSTQNILNAANKLVKNNKERIGKNLWTSNGDGEKLTLYQGQSDHAEADFVVKEIENLHFEKNMAYSQMAVFYRTNAQSRIFEDYLRKRNIPYAIYGGLRFYDRAEIKDMLGFMKVIINPSDQVSLKRILLLTPGIGKTTVDKLLSESAQKEISALDLLKNKSVASLKAASIKKLEKFYTLYHDLKDISERVLVSELLDAIWDKTGYLRNLQMQNTVEALAKVENLNELQASIKEFEAVHESPNLFNYIDQVSLFTSLDKSDNSEEDKVILMTLHMSKGLEFDVVFVVGLEERLLPHASAEFNPLELEEERRLLYVGMTRAKKLLHLSYAKMRDIYGRSQYSLPSRFLEEIPENYFNEKNLGMQIYQDKFKQAQSFERIVEYDNPNDQYKRGMRVRHSMFGAGTIVLVEGSFDNAKITVQFKYGRKKLRAKFASFEIEG